MNMQSLIDEEMAEYSDGAYADHGSARDALTRFAALVAAAERERCAKVCDEMEYPVTAALIRRIADELEQEK